MWINHSGLSFTSWWTLGKSFFTDKCSCLLGFLTPVHYLFCAQDDLLKQFWLQHSGIRNPWECPKGSPAERILTASFCLSPRVLISVHKGPMWTDPTDSEYLSPSPNGEPPRAFPLRSSPRPPGRTDDDSALSTFSLIKIRTVLCGGHLFPPLNCHSYLSYRMNPLRKRRFLMYFLVLSLGLTQRRCESVIIYYVCT